MINVVLRFYNYVDKLDSTDNDTSDKVLYTQRDVKYYWSNDDAVYNTLSLVSLSVLSSLST
jgi:hypothetical protein